MPEPGLGVAPVVVDGAPGDAEHLGHLLDGETPEVPQGDHPGLALVELGQALEGGVEVEQLLGAEPAPGVAPEAPDRVTRCQPAPRLAAPRSRAWSTRRRRITRAPTAKKWVLPFQSARVWSTSLR